VLDIHQSRLGNLVHFHSRAIQDFLINRQ
jgi:hypothetical protein